jgi:putative membrane protein
MTSEAAAQEFPAPDQLQLALERTYLAHERTLMAWVRTATSLITFGFTLYKFFFYLHEQDPARHPANLLGARTFGLVMIIIGTLTLVLASWQHRRQMKRIRAQYADAPFSLSLIVAVLIAILGILGFVAAIFGQ